MSFAFVFPGQGSQSVGMLGPLPTADSAVRATFDEASRVLGFDLWKLVSEGPEEALNATERTQPAMLAAGVAVWRVWRARGGALPEVVCGHSLGEFTALVCAEGLPFGATVELVRFRGQVMQEAVPAGSGAMAAIIGLDDEAIEAACREAAPGAVVEPANFSGARTWIFWRWRTRPPSRPHSRRPEGVPMLENEIALVTGASRGIGHAIALTLGGAGARVIGTSTSAEGAARLSATLASHRCNGRGAVLDAGDAASVDALMGELEGAGELPTILVNNAAVTRDSLLLRMKPEDWEAVITTNLTGVFRLSKACVRRMMKERRGRIVNLTSVVGVTGNPGQANYAAAKAGLLGFTKSLARELASRGITVNAVAPGFIDTDMTRALNEAQRAALVGQIPIGRLGTPADVAGAVLFLVSPQATYITGETLHVNGGMYMP